MNLEDRVDKLKNETVALRKEMIIIKTLVKQQNELIKILLEKEHGGEEYSQTFIKTRDWFPIRTQEDLDDFENTFDHTNCNEIIYEAQLCIGNEELSKCMSKILDEDLIVEYNIEGNYGKRRLLNYRNLMDVLFRASQQHGGDHSKFVYELRKGIQRIKRKKHLKQKKRQSLAESEEFEMDESQSGDSNDNEDNGYDE